MATPSSYERSWRGDDIYQVSIRHNWVVTLGPNVNGFEKDLEEFITAKRGTIQGRFVPSQWFHGHR